MIKSALILLVIIGVTGLFAQVVTIGAEQGGNTVNQTNVPCPINIYYRSMRTQTVYTTEELNDAGMVGPALISSLAFYVVGAPLHSLPFFRIRMKHTENIDASEHIYEPYQDVYFSFGYTPTEGGWDEMSFDSPFFWNGIDNILVDTSFTRTSSWNASGQVRIFNSEIGMRYGRSDSSDQINAITTSATNFKPQIQFRVGFEGLMDEIPYPAVNPSPADLAEAFPNSEKFRWNLIINEEHNNLYSGVKIWIGTDNPPTNLISGVDLGIAFFFIPEFGLQLNTQYYWKVVPYNTSGDAENVPIWSFTTFDWFDEGNGSARSPWQVATADQLKKLQMLTEQDLDNRYFLQVEDIDFEGYEWESNEGWLPIGDTENKFTGKYYGNGFLINNLFINRPEEDYLGLFGYIEGALINNVRLENLSITGNRDIGGAAGYSINSELSQSSASGIIIANNHAGILAGSVSNTTVINCYGKGDIIGEEHIGGLIGKVSNSTIRNCYSTTGITGDQNLGGLVGSRSGTISDYHNYWNVETSGITSSAVGLSRTTEQMTHPYAVNTFNGWNFVNIWAADTEYEVNDGYPYLRAVDYVSSDKNELIPVIKTTAYNYPNPFNPETTISYTLPASGRVKIEIFNVKGQKINKLYDSFTEHGTHSIVWNGRDEQGNILASGVYFCRIESEGSRLLRKMIMLR